MNYLTLALWLSLLAPPVAAQPDADDAMSVRENMERDRIRHVRSREQARFASREAECYARFAVNDCLAAVRSERREVLADLRRQEIVLNDTQRKRRGAEQLLRSDAKPSSSP